MSDITVRIPADADEVKAFVPVHRRTYLMSPEDGDDWAGWVVPENFRIAYRGDKPIGGMQLNPMGQWFGGRSVPMTGISAVGIEPAERASGGGTRFMSLVLEELQAQGTPLSSLYPATQTIYRRCGYELSGDHILYRLDTDHADARDRHLTVEFTEDRDAIKSLYAELGRRTAGILDRSERFWERIFDPYKRGKADLYLVSSEKGPEGYVAYTRTRGEHVRAHMHADVVALTRDAARRIITFVADHRSFVQTFNWNGPPADPIAFQLSDPRRSVHLSWPWMMRIVDVRGALNERGYPVPIDTELHLHVTDDVLPSNTGPVVLRVAGGKGEATAGGGGRIKIDVRGLAALYSGYASAHELLATGYIDGNDDDLALADAVFAGPAPWLADFF